jgi:hypothetical protein
MRDLAQRTATHCVHQHLEGIAVLNDGAPQALEQLSRLPGIRLSKIFEAF